MAFPLLSKLRQFLHLLPSRDRRSRRRVSRPQVEALEDRCLLAARVWSGLGPDANWSTPANWMGTVAPSASDDLFFPTGAAQLTNTNDFATGTVLRSITFTGAGYTINGTGNNQLNLIAGITSNVPTGVNPLTNTINFRIGLTGPQTFTSTNANSTLTLTGEISITGGLTVDGTGATNLFGQIIGGGNLRKLGLGTLTVSGNNNLYTGFTWVDVGILSVASNNALGATGLGQGTSVSFGATLQTTGGILTLPEPLTLAGPGFDTGLPGTTLGALTALGGSATWTGPISVPSTASINASGATFLAINGPIDVAVNTLTINSTFPASLAINGVISGPGKLVINGTLAGHRVDLTAANTYTGSTTVVNGSLNLTGNGTLASTDITLFQGGTLVLDNSGTNHNNRLPDNALLTLNGGTLSFVGNNTGGAVSSETVRGISLNRGHSGIQSQTGTGSGATAMLSADFLARVSGATVDFSGPNLGTSVNRILFGTFPTLEGSNGGIWSFATVTSPTGTITIPGTIVDFATYDMVDGVKVFTGYVTSIAAAGPTDTVKLFNVSETVSTRKTINALVLANDGTPSNVTIAPGATLTLRSGGLAMSISAGLAAPTIQPGSSASVATLDSIFELKIFSSVGSLSPTISTRISGSSGLIVGGTSTLTLNPGSAGNTHEGTTTLNSGGLNIPIGAVTPLGITLSVNPFNWYGGSLSSSGSGTLTLPYALRLDNARVSTSGITPINFTGTVNYANFNILGGGPALTMSGTIFGSGLLNKVGNLSLTVNGNMNGSGFTMTGGALTINSISPTILVNAVGGTLGGTGQIGTMNMANGAGVNPGQPGSAGGTLFGGGADFSKSGNLTIQIAGFATPGVSYDRLWLGGTLILGGNSVLTLDLAGLTSGGTANAVLMWNAIGGVFNVVNVINNPNNFQVALEYTANALNVIVGAAPNLVVSNLMATHSGFTALFNRTLDTTDLNLYETQSDSLGPIDVTLVGAVTGPVRGSLVVDPSGNRITFLRSGGVLPADTYTATLRSAFNGFNDTMGTLLDGNADGMPGDNHVATFTVAPSAAVVVSLPEFTRGPGQVVNVPATGTGIPLRLSDGAGVDAIDLTLRYNPALLTITAATVGPNVPPGALVLVNVTTPGTVVLGFISPEPLGPGPIDWVTLTATVPNGAPYTSKHVLDIISVQINEGTISARDDDGLHVNAYFGDTTGNARYSATDATRALRVAVGIDGGFSAYQLADPVVIADITGNGQLNATDATRLLQESIGIDRPEIPALPATPPTILVSGPDPLLSIPRRFRGRPGGLVTVPVNLDPSAGLDSANLALSYDPRQLEVVKVGRGSLTRDFDLFAVNHDAEAGTLRVGMGRSAGAITNRGNGSVLLITFRIKPDAPAGRAVINLRQDLGTMLTQLNEGGLTLNPDPSNQAGDVLDGIITVTRRKNRAMRS